MIMSEAQNMRDFFGFLAKLGKLDKDVKKLAYYNGLIIARSEVDENGGRDDTEREAKLQGFLDQIRKD